MAERLAKFKEEAIEFNRRKLLATMDENMEFHEWMEKHKKVGASNDEIENELDLNDLIQLGEECGIPHPFSCQSSPFFNNVTKEQILEISNPTVDQRPFPDLKSLVLIDINEKEGASSS